MFPSRILPHAQVSRAASPVWLPADGSETRMQRPGPFRRLSGAALFVLLGLVLLAASQHGSPSTGGSVPHLPSKADLRIQAEGTRAPAQISPGERGAIQGPTPPLPVLPSAPAVPNTCVSLGGINWGACWQSLWTAISQGLSQALSQFLGWASSFGFFFITPAFLTYQHGVVQALWRWSVTVVDAALVLFLVLGGYQAVLHHSLGVSYPSVLEFLPRLLLAAVAAHFSLSLLSSFIELNNTLCTAILGALATAGAGNLTLPFVLPNLLTFPFYVVVAYLIDVILSALLVVQMLVRLALLDLLLILSPIWLLLLSLKPTERVGRLGMIATGTTIFLQALWTLTLAAGSALISGFGHSSATPLTLLVGIAALYLAFRLPGMLSHALLHPLQEAGSQVNQLSARLLMVL